MRFITFKKEEEEKSLVGVLSRDGRRVVELTELGLTYSSMIDLIEGISELDLKKLRQAINEDRLFKMSIDDIILSAVIPRPKQDIICLGVNYLEHAKESARYKKEAFELDRSYPVYFSKRVNRATAHGESIQSHDEIVDTLDYEVELAVVIGKDAYKVPYGNGQDYIFGYTIINDMSARNLQTRHNQWYFGKSLDGFTPMGPVLVTKDEISYPPKLIIQSRVNGELRQDSSTENLIFDIEHVIHELSQGMTLQAGTIIAMGTPSGVGMGFDPPRFLRSGDLIECYIEKIGTLSNRID